MFDCAWSVLWAKITPLKTKSPQDLSLLLFCVVELKLTLFQIVKKVIVLNPFVSGNVVFKKVPKPGDGILSFLDLCNFVKHHKPGKLFKVDLVGAGGVELVFVFVKTGHEKAVDLIFVAERQEVVGVEDILFYPSFALFQVDVLVVFGYTFPLVALF